MNYTPSAGPSRRGWHRLSDHFRCPQLYAYRHLLNLQPLREPRGRALGALIHLGLMWHYLRRLGRSDIDPIVAMREAPSRIAHVFDDARRILIAYMARGDVDPFVPLDVEREYEYRLGPHLGTLRLDLVVRWRGPALPWLNGKLVVCDHKTGAQPEKSRMEYETSGQLKLAGAVGRALLAPMYGLEFGGVIVNAVGTGSGEEVFVYEVPRDEAADRAAVAGAVFANDMIEAADRFAGGDPWSYPRSYACLGQYKCDYFDLCHRGGRDALYGFVSAVDEATDHAPEGG